MRVACLTATAIFALFAYWQLNDLEQYGTNLWFGWMLTYGAVSLVSAISAARPLPRAVYATGATVAAVGALVRSTGIEWGGPILYNETNPAGNETGGLLVVALWLGSLAIIVSRRGRGTVER